MTKYLLATRTEPKKGLFPRVSLGFIEEKDPILEGQLLPTFIPNSMMDESTKTIVELNGFMIQHKEKDGRPSIFEAVLLNSYNSIPISLIHLVKYGDMNLEGKYEFRSINCFITPKNFPNLYTTATENQNQLLNYINWFYGLPLKERFKNLRRKHPLTISQGFAVITKEKQTLQTIYNALDLPYLSEEMVTMLNNHLPK